MLKVLRKIMAGAHKAQSLSSLRDKNEHKHLFYSSQKILTSCVLVPVVCEYYLTQCLSCFLFALICRWYLVFVTFAFYQL